MRRAAGVTPDANRRTVDLDHFGRRWRTRQTLKYVAPVEMPLELKKK
jgi:hypothetical protein